MALKLGMAFLLAGGLVGLPNLGYTSMQVIAEPGMDPTYVGMVQKTVDAFNEVVQQEVGTTLEQDVKVFVCPTRDSYKLVLQREMGQNSADADRIAAVSGGFSRGGSNVVAVNFDLSKGGNIGFKAYKTTAHELFHQLQYQLAGKNMGNGFYWMKEGTADLIGSAVAEKVGYQSMEKWKLDEINQLRKADTHVSPRLLQTASLNQWMTFMESKQSPYEVSDLMAFYLTKQMESGGYRNIAEYYKLVGQGMENNAAFEKTFGLSSSKFVTDFDVWLADTSSQSATIEVVASDKVASEVLTDFNQGIDVLRQFFITTWERDIAGSMRLVVTAGKPAYAAAMSKELGIDVKEAEKRAENSVWWYAGSTAIYNMDGVNGKSRRLFKVTNSIVQRFMGETASIKKLKELEWMVNGGSEVTTALIIERCGASSIESYRNYWLSVVRKAEKVPALTQLTTEQDWNRAKTEYGGVTVSCTADLAGLYIMEKYGAPAFNDWCKAVQTSGNVEVAFEQVFGLNTTQFNDDFAAYLGKNR